MPGTKEDAAREEQLMYGHGALTIDELDEKYPNRPHNHAKTPVFSQLYLTLFNPLAENRKKPAHIIARSKTGPDGPLNLTPHEARRQIIERFIGRWRKEVGNDFYPAMRLMIPDKDRDRAMYGLKESTIGKLLVKVMKINKDSEDGYNLMHWKLPGLKSYSAMAGDFAGRCYEVISKRPIISEPGTLTIAEVNAMLDRLSVAQKEENQLPIIDEFYNRMNAEELKYLIRIILRQIKIGASEKTILELWHPDAENLFNISSSLRRVCWDLPDPNERLESDKRGINLMQCFQPQLAAFQMQSMERMVGRMKPTDDDNVFWIEEKLDGERMQLHMIEDENHPGGKRFSFWSRKAKDYTYLYGNGHDDDQSSLTRHLRNAFHDGVRNIILDGEMIVWDPNTEAMVPFGHLKTAALLEQANPFSGGIRPVYMVFDCLFLNDVDLTPFTLRKRREALDSSVTNIDKRLEIHPYHEATQASEIEPLLRTVVAESSEGLVLKNPRSAYRLNERNDDWIKVKPEYMTEFGEALDCIVIGGYYGSGHRGGALSSFMCGLKVPQELVDAGADPQKCYSFFKVGGGFSASDYADIRHRTEGKWKQWNSKSPPTDFIILGGGDRQFERPDVWIKPEDSLVFEVKAASVHVTEQFGIKYTLRFPRFKKIRQDKDWTTALSVTDFTQLKHRAETEQKEKAFKIDDARRQKRMTKRKRPLVVQGHSEEVRPLSAPKTELFHGMSFMVLSESQKPKKSKADVEALIRGNGGTIVASDKDPSTIIISDRNVVKAASIAKRGERNIVRPRWVFDCANQNAVDGEHAVLPFEPKHMLFTRDMDQSKFANNVDSFGDSYYRDISVEELSGMLEEMAVPSETITRARDQLADEGLYLPDVDFSFFDGLEAFFAADEPKCRQQFEFAGGNQVDRIGSSTTHIILADDGSGKADARKKAASMSLMPRVVTTSWISESWKQGTRLDEERYALV